MQAFATLGPLSREMFDYSLRDISIRKLMSKFVLRNADGWDGDGAPPARVVWTEPRFDAAFAVFVRAEYRRSTGHDPVDMRLVAASVTRVRRR